VTSDGWSLFADPAQLTRQLAEDLLKYKRLDGVDGVLRTLLDTLLDGDGPRLDAVPLLAKVEVPVAVVWAARTRCCPR
jgi:pyruvate dehydrogenase E2 component (dihydrolipoamide acetyltransferase)